MADLEAAGTRLFAISYDSVEVLADFAGKYGIAFPLLSDEGSKVIRSLGLYNEHLAEQARFYGREPRSDQYGVPYPGIFYLDEHGVVVEKAFEQSYRVRPSSELLVQQAVGRSSAESTVARTAERDGISVTAAVDAATFRPYEKHQLQVVIDLPPGIHIYSSSVPEGYAPLAISVAAFDGLDLGPIRLPAPRRLHIEGLDEELLVHEGRVEAAAPFNIVPFVESVTLSVTVSYQACTDSVCYPPDSVVLDVPLRGVDLIRE